LAHQTPYSILKGEMAKTKKPPKKRGSKKKKEDKKRPRFDVHREAIKSLWGVIFVILFLLTILSFIGKAGAAGDVFAHSAELIFGWGRFIIPLAFLAASYILFTSWRRNSYIPLIIGGVLFFSGILGLVQIISGGETLQGGYWGYGVSLPLVTPFGNIAAAIIFLGLIVVSFIISFNIKVGKFIEDRRIKIAERKEYQEADSSDSQGAEQAIKDSSGGLQVKTWKDREKGDSGKGERDVAPSTKKRGEEEKRSGADKAAGKDSDDFAVKDLPGLAGDFHLPPIELLETETGKPSSGDIVANANIIKRTLQNFGVEVEMGEVNVGPTVTQFTLKPAEGVKLTRILGLHNDLSLALAAHPIRIEAPIPGRSLVGIEIPNKGFALVRLKNLLEGEEFTKRSSRTLISLGRDVSGEGIYANLAKMPHLLIAGSTGSGKTIALNIVILSLLYQNSPQTLKFILIDPKRVEFPVFSDIPHLLAPIVVDTQKTVNALKWTVSEMERRFDVLAGAKARDIAAFNSNKKTVEEFGLLPYIVIVIDELADLMASRGKEIEALIVRLAQMSRAVGIHLVLATQRPSVEVITGLIKANITSRIAFQVASQIDSRTVLDMAGAEKLLGNGDMLYLSGDASKPRRIQGAYVTDKEIRRVTDYLREEGVRLRGEEGAEDDAELDLQTPPSPSSGQGTGKGSSASVDFEDIEGDGDDLYEEARKVVIQSKKASSSLLQRRLRVGYARAARLMDMLEEEGVIGPGEGAKPREVYIGRDGDE